MALVCAAFVVAPICFLTLACGRAVEQLILDLGDGDDADGMVGEGSSIMRLIAEAAAAQGIPLQWILQQGGPYEEDEGPVDYPFDTCPTSLTEVADFMQSDKCKKILILAGAGMSGTMGISLVEHSIF